jgi:hypothetical protein
MFSVQTINGVSAMLCVNFRLGHTSINILEFGRRRTYESLRGLILRGVTSTRCPRALWHKPKAVREAFALTTIFSLELD